MTSKPQTDSTRSTRRELVSVDLIKLALMLLDNKNLMHRRTPTPWNREDRLVDWITDDSLNMAIKRIHFLSIHGEKVRNAFGLNGEIKGALEKTKRTVREPDFFHHHASSQSLLG